MESEQPACDLSEQRRALIQLASSGRTRRVERSPTRPSDWRPTQVTDPRTGTYFTEAGAWEFIAERLAAGEPLKLVALEKPPGKNGYSMTVPGPPDKPLIYLKLEFGHGCVYGRSFHYSYPVECR